MGNELTKIDVMPIEDLKKNINLIQKVLRGVMIKGTHYDVVPGCGSKETLLKPGAEKILSTFRIGVNCEVTDLGNADERRYRVTAKGFHIPTGNPIGEGIGECSTAEKKYQWREAICDKEYEETNEDRRQIMYKKEGGYKAGQPVTIKEIKQIRTSPADIANTVLKMAKKRAVVDLCLSATACSDIFTQDLDEDLDPTIPSSSGEGKQPEPPKDGERVGNKASNPISEAQLNRLYKILSLPSAKHTQDELHDYIWTKHGITSTKEIDKSFYQNVTDWIEGKLI